MKQTINNQIKTDEQLKTLVLTMKRAYEFADKAYALEHIELHAGFFEKMARATLECGNFIREYVDSGSFGESILASQKHYKGGLTHFHFSRPRYQRHRL